MNIFSRREVLTTFSMKEFNDAKEALLAKGIKYSFRVVNIGSSFLGTERSRLGSFGINQDYSRQYYLYVDKEDYKEAAFVVGV